MDPRRVRGPGVSASGRLAGRQARRLVGSLAMTVSHETGHTLSRQARSADQRGDTIAGRVSGRAGELHVIQLDDVAQGPAVFPTCDGAGDACCLRNGLLERLDVLMV